MCNWICGLSWVNICQYMTTSVWFCTSPCWIWRLECKKNVPKLKNMGADNSPDDFWYHRRIPFRDSMFHGSKSSSLTICWSGPLLKTWFLLVNHLSKDPMFCWLIFLCWLKSQFSQLKHLFKKKHFCGLSHHSSWLNKEQLNRSHLTIVAA